MKNLKELIASLPQTDNRTDTHIVKTRLIHKRHYITWTEVEDAIVQHLYQEKFTPLEVSKLLERTENAVRMRIETKQLDRPITAPPVKNTEKKMDFKKLNPMLKVLHYWRNSLADESKIGLPPQKMKAGQSFTLEQIASGNLPINKIETFFTDAEKLLKNKNKYSKKQREDFTIHELPVIIAPYTAVKNYEHGKEKGANTLKDCFPLWLTATLRRDGSLVPDEDNLTLPWIERQCLTPNQNDEKSFGFPIIGDVSDTDVFYTLNAENIGKDKKSWQRFFGFSKNLLQSLLVNQPDVLERQNVTLIEKGYVLCLSTIQDTVKPILNIYDHYLSPKREIPCLLANFLSLDKEKASAGIPFSELLTSNHYHSAQMEKSYPLSKSQRLSMNYHTFQKEGEVFTIHGPPGTGKTTVLLSVIATAWVNAALEKKPPPLIVATSTNNLAVTNILDSFDKTRNDDAVLESRWLPEINSFGAYLCPSSKENEANEKGYLYSLRDGSGSLSNFYNDDYRGIATSFFLQQFNAHFKKQETNLQQCQEYIHQQLTEKKQLLAETIDLLLSYKSLQERVLQYADNFLTFYNLIEKSEEEIKQLVRQQKMIKKQRADWFSYKSTAFKWIQFLQWLPFIKQLIREKAKSYTANNHVFFDRLYDSTEAIDAFFEDKLQRLCIEKKYQTLSELNEVKKAYDLFIQNKMELESQIGITISLEKLYDYQDPEHYNCLLDTTLRFDLFILASHYWEATWLLESSPLTALSKTFDGRQQYWQIQSMLTPCFVTTFHSGVAFFNYHAPSKEFEPLSNFIDLLIIDEAGQVLPALAGAMVSIAKKALMVGDALQIEPIFKIPENIDMANAKKFNLCDEELGYEELKNTGILCSGNNYTCHSYGNLITVGQRKAKYHLQHLKLPGMLLLEHRRCPAEIISYCNELCYDNQLIPLAPEKKSCFPRMGYAHIKGFEQATSGSRYNKTEAMVIAEWVAKNHRKILEDCQKEHLDDCLAIVTPFAAQKHEIQSALQKHEISLSKLGTIHSLQGAEKEIVIFSSVYTSASKEGFFFDVSPNMLNVAVSRAKRSFLVFGDMDIFDPSRNHPSSLLAKYLFAQETNELTDIVVPVWPELNADDVEPITTLQQHRQQLIQSFSKARDVLNIVSPYLYKNAIESDDIEQHIKNQSSRIVINIYTDPFLNLKNKHFQELLTLLTQAGANVFLVDKVHSKIITIDNRMIILGSFNWLSASRSSSTYTREETSLIYQGNKASSIIKETLEPIKSKIKKQVQREETVLQ